MKKIDDFIKEIKDHRLDPIDKSLLHYKISTSIAHQRKGNIIRLIAKSAIGTFIITGVFVGVFLNIKTNDIGRITFASDNLLTDTPVKMGDKIELNKPIKLLSGSVQIELENGSKTQIQAPAEIVITKNKQNYEIKLKKYSQVSFAGTKNKPSTIDIRTESVNISNVALMQGESVALENSGNRNNIENNTKNSLTAVTAGDQEKKLPAEASLSLPAESTQASSSSSPSGELTQHTKKQLRVLLTNSAVTRDLEGYGMTYLLGQRQENNASYQLSINRFMNVFELLGVQRPMYNYNDPKKNIELLDSYAQELLEELDEYPGTEFAEMQIQKYRSLIKLLQAKDFGVFSDKEQARLYLQGK